MSDRDRFNRKKKKQVLGEKTKKKKQKKTKKKKQKKKKKKKNRNKLIRQDHEPGAEVNGPHPPHQGQVSSPATSAEKTCKKKNWAGTTN